jgi:hypothetical protein
MSTPSNSMTNIYDDKDSIRPLCTLSNKEQRKLNQTYVMINKAQVNKEITLEKSTRFSKFFNAFNFHN